MQVYVCRIYAFTLKIKILKKKNTKKNKKSKKNKLSVADNRLKLSNNNEHNKTGTHVATFLLSVDVFLHKSATVIPVAIIIIPAIFTRTHI